MVPVPLPIHVLHLSSVCRKSFSQRIGLIREGRKCRSKEKQTGQNNNNLAIKQSEEPESYPLSCLVGTETPTSRRS